MDDRTSKSALSGFASFLAENKLLKKEVALKNLDEATKEKQSYIEFLIKRRLLSPSVVAKATAEYFGLPLCDIRNFNFELIPKEFLNIQLVRKRLVLPVFIKKGFLYIALADPTIENLYDIRFLTGYDIRLLITESPHLNEVLDKLLNTLIISEMDEEHDDERETVRVDAVQEEEIELAAYDVESAPVVNFVNKILIDAIEKNASDIHFEHFASDYRIRYRLNGVLYPVATPPLKLANYLLARIKIMSNLDITEHRIPQDGRFKLTLSKQKTIDFRVSVCPTLFGEKIVLRLLDPKQASHAVNQLGMESEQELLLLDAVTHTQGLILVTGPTGSGKTMTLYSILNYLNSPDDNIMTVEDPVEIPLHGVNQVHVNPKVGLDFSSALRAFLRQDPDIIMVGEIRDLETAGISVRAAQTGHLVLSTLHTNSGPETIIRLMNMGVEPYNLASSLILVIAQRLLRVLCDFCKQEEKHPDDVLIKEGFDLKELKQLKIFKASECEHCTHGYSGRTAIFEMMPISADMVELILQGGNTVAIKALAKKEGVRNLRDAGLDKIRRGITSLSELNRTFK